ncbi:hypothetical protein AVEN_22859-1 [Araneus ventricosus]|uniref:CCHC-type domain-containing protein n=1 Tax=Araneus ventricosus TaxID=182803 RepID=A0A4Y2IVE5_ARAVE|nr:hypothetical protein AVEN_22859-1 [Araneus ventricosus]
MTGPGTVGPPYKFGQSNPFVLPTVPSSGLGAKMDNKPGTGYIGFGLSSGLPVGTAWGETPFPGSLAAARLMGQAGKGTTVGAPPSETPSEHQIGMELVPGAGAQRDSMEAGEIPQAVVNPGLFTPAPADIGGNEDLGVVGASLYASGNYCVGIVPPTPAAPSEIPIAEAMDVGVKSGHKRKPVRIRAGTKKDSKHQPEGAVNTLQLDSSSSGSDRTIVVSDTPSEATEDETRVDMEVPSTPSSSLVEEWGPDALAPDDPVLGEKYSFQNTGACPWIHRLAIDYFKKYPRTSESLENIGELFQVISAVYEDLSRKLNEFESIKRRLEVLEASHAKPSFSQVVGTPLFSEGGPGPFPSTSVTVRGKGSSIGKPKRDRPPVSLLPARDPPMPDPLVPSVPKSSGVSVPSLPVPSAPVRERSHVPFKPRPESPMVIVHPLGDSLNSSKALRSLLEEHIRPQQLGLRVMSCLPAAECGVLVTLQTKDMATLLESHINGHTELNGVCRARLPRRPNPRILIYDVPSLPGDRVAQENGFLAKLRVSNSFPDGGRSVLFRRRGRGSAQHWVLSIDPVIYHCIHNTNRLHWGLGSLRFRAFSEPIQCFRCLKFGHTQSRCRAPEELGSSCQGTHSFKNCLETQSKCRNCWDFNRNNRTGPRLQVTHTAVSRKCPIFLSACEEIKNPAYLLCSKKKRWVV